MPSPGETYVTHVVALHLNGATSIGAIRLDYPGSGVTYANVRGFHIVFPAQGNFLGSSKTVHLG